MAEQVVLEAKCCVAQMIKWLRIRFIRNPAIIEIDGEERAMGKTVCG